MKKFQRLVSVFALSCVIAMPVYADGGMSGDVVGPGGMSGDAVTPVTRCGGMSGDVTGQGGMSGDVVAPCGGMSGDAVTPSNDSQSSLLHSVFGWFGVFGF